MRPDLELQRLVDLARDYVMSKGERKKQKQSFARGNVDVDANRRRTGRPVSTEFKPKNN